MKALLDNKKKCTVLTNNGILALIMMSNNSERKFVFSHRLTYQNYIKNEKTK